MGGGERAKLPGSGDRMGLSATAAYSKASFQPGNPVVSMREKEDRLPSNV